jgi:two-component system response regulator NreC
MSILNIKEMMDIGAYGYLLKNIGPKELVMGIESVLSGKHYFSPELTLKMVNAFKYGWGDAFNKNTNSTTKKLPVYANEKVKSVYLTKREEEILKLTSDQKPIEIIAKTLNISKRTAECHKLNMFKKFNVNNTTSLVKCAIELRII